MLLGIIGYGIVGQAIGQAFLMQNCQIKWYDKYKNDSITFDEISPCECVFVCVPTNTVDGNCDVSTVIDTIDKLDKIAFKGLIIIKSTVVPGTTQTLIDQYPELRIVFVPEFLRQDSALDDFLHTNDALIVGAHSNIDFNAVVELHKSFSTRAIKLAPTEAELTKYFANNFNSLRIVYANAYYEVCESLGVDYQKVLAAATALPGIHHDHYLKCNPGMRGYAGKCLPKDIEAFNSFVKTLNLPIAIFDAVIKDNEQYTKK